MKSKTIPINDLRYELRMLLGAAKVCELFETTQMGNVVNYIKDSAYMHARNLYNFFAADTKNDAKVTQFTNHKFDLIMYETWKDALHSHVLHIKSNRHTPTNIVNNTHLNTIIPVFAKNVTDLWQEWIDNTEQNELKETLIGALMTAQKEAQDDYNGMIIKGRGGKQ